MREIIINNTTYVIVNDISCEIEENIGADCIFKKEEKYDCEIEIDGGN